MISVIMMMILMILMIMIIFHQERKASKCQNFSLPNNQEKDHDLLVDNFDDDDGVENYDDENIKSMMMMTIMRIA